MQKSCGVERSEVRDALSVAHGYGLSAAEARDLLWHITAAVRAYGTIDELGDFLEAELEDGKRGSELFAAVQSEHARRGEQTQRKRKRARPRVVPSAVIVGGS